MTKKLQFLNNFIRTARWCLPTWCVNTLMWKLLEIKLKAYHLRSVIMMELSWTSNRDSWTWWTKFSRPFCTSLQEHKRKQSGPKGWSCAKEKAKKKACSWLDWSLQWKVFRPHSWVQGEMEWWVLAEQVSMCWDWKGRISWMHHALQC